MPSNSMPGFWKQRKQAFLDFPPLTRSLEVQIDTPPYLRKVQMSLSTEDFYIFNGQGTNLPANNYSFEESFWFVPNLLEFVEYQIDPESGDVTILQPSPSNPPKTGADKITFIFEKMLLNLVPEGGPVLAPTTEHPCDADDYNPDTAETTAGSNCMQPIVMPNDDHFVLFYFKDSQKVYRTDASPDHEVRFNNYLIPTLSADMSMWWYKIPNPMLNDDESAKKNAEEALKIWHTDRKRYLEELPNHSNLTSTHYIGVYQRSYFCDELQMRFTNLARIGNDYTIPLEYGIQELDGITYQPLNTDKLG
jgi:hypothetical protein